MRVLSSFALPASHIFMELSQLPDAKVFPSGEKQTEYTEEECPVRVCLQVRLLMFRGSSGSGRGRGRGMFRGREGCC